MDISFRWKVIKSGSTPGGRTSPVRSGSSTGAFHGVDRRQAHVGGCPALAAILRDPQAAGSRAEGEAVAGLVRRQGMTIDEVVGVALWQAPAQNVEAAAAVAGSGDDELAVERDALLVL